MANQSRQVAVKKYFTATPTPTAFNFWGTFLAICIVLGVIFGCYATLFFMDEGLNPLVVLVGGGLVLAAAYGLTQSSSSNADKKYKALLELAEPKPSDNQMDIWLENDKQKIITDSMTKLDLIHEQVLNPNDPLVVIGPQTNSKIAIGKDNVFRFSKYEIVVIFLTNYHLGAYKCDLDFETGDILNEQTQEYHYTDVISVSTFNENTPFAVNDTTGKKVQIASHQQFALSVANGDKIKVTISFPQLPNFLKTGKIRPSGAETAISTLRTMLREKKGGIQKI